MTASPWDVLITKCEGASEAIIAAPYIKVRPLIGVMERLRVGASVTCVTRWTAQDIQAGMSDIDCRTIVVERGGSFLLNNRLHAKYYRFDDHVLVGSANMTDSGLSHTRQGNLEVLCHPEHSFNSAAFEVALNQHSREVSDEDFSIWQQYAVIEPEHLQAARSKRNLVDSIEHINGNIEGWNLINGIEGESAERNFVEGNIEGWIPQTRNPSYLWLCYSGNEEQIVSYEQRTLASLDIRTLKVPAGLTLDAFHAWVSLRLQRSTFINSIRQLEGQHDTVVWDSIANEWGVSRATAARWASTACNWLKNFDLGCGS